MSTNTSHYNLVKPAGSEAYDVSVQNGNMEKIDAALWNLPATYKRSLTTSDDLNSLSDGVYYITANMPLNVPNGDIDIAYSILLQVSTSVIKHQYIIKPFTGVFYMREYSGTPTWKAWRCISNRAVATDITSQTNITGGKIYLVRSGFMRQLVVDDAVLPSNAAYLTLPSMTTGDQPTVSTEGILRKLDGTLLYIWIRGAGTWGQSNGTNGATLNGNLVWFAD